MADGGGGREEEVVVVEEEEEAAETSHRPVLLLLLPLTHTPSHSNGWRRGMVVVGNCMVLRKEEKEGTLSDLATKRLNRDFVAKRIIRRNEGQ